jgi:AcrR family transcriptional regulator
MAGGAEATKQRILEAAIASANNQLIYAYFGSKQELFDAAIADQLERYHAAVPFDPSRLADFAVDMYDFFITHPELARLGVWHSLEEGQQEHPISAIAQLWRQRIRVISRAQREGSVNATIHARDLLILVFAVARAYIVTTPEVREAGRRGVARQRRTVYQAVQRLVEPV